MSLGHCIQCLRHLRKEFEFIVLEIEVILQDSTKKRFISDDF